MPETTPLTELSPAAVWAAYGPAIVQGLLNTLAAATILVVGLWLSGRLAVGARRIAERHPRMDATVSAFLGSIVRYVAIAVVLIAVLQTFGIPTTSIVAVLGAATLAIGLALQGTLSNVAAGVMLVMFRPYRIGDYVDVGGRSGVVAEVGLFVTELRSVDNARIVLPNAKCWGEAIVNYSAYETRRLEVKVAVAYDTDLDRAEEIVRATLLADARVLRDPAPMVKVATLGDYAITVLAHAWCRTADHYLLGLDLQKAVKQALDGAGIDIPFPTSTQYAYAANGPPPGPPRRS